MSNPRPSRQDLDNTLELGARDLGAARKILLDELAYAKLEPDRLRIVNGEMVCYKGRKRVSCPGA